MNICIYSIYFNLFIRLLIFRDLIYLEELIKWDYTPRCIEILMKIVKYFLSG